MSGGRREAGLLGLVAHGGGNGAQYSGRSIKLGSGLIWSMLQRGDSAWTGVVARAAAGRPVGGAGSGRGDGGSDQSDDSDGEGMG